MSVARRNLLAICLMLQCLPVIASSTGSPQCTVDVGTLSAVHGPQVGTSPNGWSISISPTFYNSSTTHTITLSNSNSSKQFKGILLWATDSGGTLRGSFSPYPSGFKDPGGCSSASLTQTNNTVMTQRTFNWTAPATSAGSLTFRAFVIENCGGSCQQFYYAVNPVVIGPALSPGTVAGNSLRITKSTAMTGGIDISWGTGCVGSVDKYGLYAGTLGNFYSHFSLNCSLTGTTWTELPAAGDIYYLVVPQISIQSSEGGYGKDSSGNQIPFAVPACRPNHLSATTCP